MLTSVIKGSVVEFGTLSKAIAVPKGGTIYIRAGATDGRLLLKLTESRVSQIRSKALGNLRKIMAPLREEVA